MADYKSLSELTDRLNEKYRNVEIQGITDNSDGSYSISISGKQTELEKALSGLGVKQPIRDLPEVEDVNKLRLLNRATASTISRDPLSRDVLDLAKSKVSSESPQVLYERSVEYYRQEYIYGSSIDALTNFATKGFKNYIDDSDIRNFYDNWVVDIGFDDIVEKIFFEFFRSGFVRTYKITAKYEPKINHISNLPGVAQKKVTEDTASYRADVLKQIAKRKSELSAKKIKWSKDHLPIKYTILNPTQIEIEEGSILIDQQLIKIKGKALEPIKKLLEVKQSDLTEHQKTILKSIPPDMKKAAESGDDYPLDPYLVGEVDYRRQPYELYPIPRGARAFEPLEYKRELRKADYSTLDGITNYLLVITIGNDTFPVKSTTELEKVAELFNTPSKAFDVVWNHTLRVERIEPSNIGDILGQDKYKQVNEDITGAFGVVRALIDGVGGGNKAALDVAVKAVEEEINYARRQVRRWIYKEYRDVAQAMGFDRYPKVLFDEMALKDILKLKALIQGMIDRRIISYRSGLDQLGFDFDTMVEEMKLEKDLVLDGTLGIIGSPYQQAKLGLSTSPSGNVQTTQRTPKGTPSEGRPQNQTQVPNPDAGVADKTGGTHLNNSLDDFLEELSISEVEDLISYLRSKVKEKV